VVSFGVFPAIFLLSYGKFNPWFLPGAFLMVAASVIRLSYFNIFGLIDNKTYMGLALDNNVIILSFVFLFEGLITPSIFSIILYALLMGSVVFNLAPIRTPKFAGKWFYVLIVYSFVLSIVYGWLQCRR
jgi:phosphatidylserine synthase